MAREITTHVARLGAVVLGRPGVAGFALVVVAVVGLVLESRAGRRRIPARFLLLLLAIAFVGGLTRQIPFGPAAGRDADVYPGGRASLWLLPSLATGLAFACDRVVRATRRVSVRAGAAVSLLLVACAVILVGVNVRDTPLYPVSGAGSVHDYVLQHRGRNDVVIMLPNAVWAYAAEPGVAMREHVDARLLNGFSPVLRDPSIWSGWPSSPWNGTDAELRHRIASAKNVFIVDGYVGLFDQEFGKLEAALGRFGLRRVDRVRVGTYALEVWARSTP